MKHAEDIIIRPFVTEKSNAEVESGKYTFIVDSKATKTQIRMAAEKLFQVKVLKVNTINYEGKVKRMGAHQGPRPDWKKAIILIDREPKYDAYLAKGGKQASSGKKYKTGIDEYGVAQ